MKRRIIHGLLALLIACGLWVYVITVDNPNDETTIYEIPVVLSGETFLHERGLMLSTQNTPTVTLTLSGKRSELKKVNKSNITVVADLSKIADSGKLELNYDITFPGDVPDNAINVESRLPDRVTVNVEGRTSKNVEVKVHYKGEVKDGYIADKNSLELDNKFIAITGPTAVLDNIDHASIEVNLKDRSEDIDESVTYTLCDARGKAIEDITRVETKVSDVELKLKIQRLKEVQLVVDVIYGGGATKVNTDVVLDMETIQVTGSELLLEGLDELKLGTINLAELMEDTVLEFPIVLPDDVNNVTGVTEATVKVDFKNLETKTFMVSVVEGIRVPDGMKAEIMTKVVPVVLRGPLEQIRKLTEEDVVVRVDFSGAGLGATTYDATIYVDPEFAGVGAVGTYSVSAKLTADTEKEE